MLYEVITIDGRNAAVEMSQAEVPISEMLEPMVKVPRSTERATQPQESRRKESRRGRVFDF